MKVAIIGAGAAGLASARRVIQYGLDCVVFETTDSIGGLWVYNENTVCNTDEIHHSCIYASLKTNLPTQLMEFTGYKFEPKSGLCYPSHEEVLQYIQNFAREHDLIRYVKFYNQVIKIKKKENRWKITVKHVKTGEIKILEFDAVMVCSGHNSQPFIPHIRGRETFKGYQIHSHIYRRNSPYKGKRILVVGAGASGLDISLECAEVAEKLFLCCGSKEIKSYLGDNVVKKTSISKIEGNEIFFQDSTSEKVDAIIFCTGYEYYFPFLDSSCEVQLVDKKVLKPLYKYFLNIYCPSMCFIGLTQKSFVFALFDLQAEVFVKLLKNNVKEPSRGHMMREFKEELDKKSEKSLSHYFYLSDVKHYFDELAALGNIKPLPPVLFKIYEKNRETFVENYKSLKNQIFEVLDDECFLRSIV